LKGSFLMQRIREKPFLRKFPFWDKISQIWIT